MKPNTSSFCGFNRLQQISTSLMAVMVLLTFVGSNFHAVLWQSSEWLVSTILPAVVVDLTNDERAERNAAPLQRSATLDEAARLKAEHMAKNEYFAHHSPDGISPWHWFREAGYVYAHAGENLAIHFTDSDEVVDAWMDSPTHRANIVDNKYVEIGVGTAKGKFEGYNTVYVVQLFGAPAAVPEPLLASEAETQTVPESVILEPEPTELVLETSTATEVLVADPVALAPVESQIEPEVAAEVLPDVDSVLVAETGSEFGSTDAPRPLPILESEVVSEPSSVPPEAAIVKVVEDVVMVETPVIATSSGLAVANITTEVTDEHAGATVASIATKPNALLQYMYVVLGVVVLTLLLISAVLEARRFHYVQVAYSMALLVGMAGLWYAHSLLTTGAVIA